MRDRPGHAGAEQEMRQVLALAATPVTMTLSQAPSGAPSWVTSLFADLPSCAEPAETSLGTALFTASLPSYVEPAEVYLGTVLLSDDKFKDASAELETAVLLDPYDPAAHAYLAFALGKLNRETEAKEHFGRVE